MIFSKRNLSTKARSKRSEKRAQKIFGGRIQPASGALNVTGLKGDILSAKFLVDDKTTASGSFSINSKLWRKLRREAMIVGRAPALRIEFSETSQVLYVFDELSVMEFLSK